jgi:hypothetical protein
MLASRLMASPQASFKRANERIDIEDELLLLDEPSVGIALRLKA